MKRQPSPTHRHIALASCFLTALALAACDREPPPSKPAVRPVRAMRVAGPEEQLLRSFPGVASASTEVNLAFRVGGPLVTRPVDVGDEVKAGDVVARIDPRDYQTRVGTLEGQLAAATAEKDYAQNEYTKVSELLKVQAAKPREVEEWRAKRDAANGNMTALNSQLDHAKDQLGYTYLKAPFDGRVVATYVENFEDVIPKRPIVRLIDRRRIEFKISIPESLIGYAPYVEDIVIRFDAFEGREFKATIKEIGEEATQATRTYPVTLVMDQPEEKDVEILAGMAGDASITSRPPDLEEGGGIAIPAAAVFSDSASGDTFVWVCDEAKRTLERRKIDAKNFSDTGLLVKAGLSAGEWVVVAGVHSAKDGQQVRILDVTTGKEVQP